MLHNCLEMVAVSSTVIPVANLFGNPKPEASGTGEVVPYFPSYLYTRKSRFFEKSSKPDTPVRLITKSEFALCIYLLSNLRIRFVCFCLDIIFSSSGGSCIGLFPG